MAAIKEALFCIAVFLSLGNGFTKTMGEIYLNSREILEQVKKGNISVDEAEKFFRKEPFEEMGYAKIDTHRKHRCGHAEVIFCSNKADEHLKKIFGRILEEEGEVLGTRASVEQYEMLKKEYPDVQYDPISRIIKIEKKNKEHRGQIVICSAGTADIPVAEEAAQTANSLGIKWSVYTMLESVEFIAFSHG